MQIMKVIFLFKNLLLTISDLAEAIKNIFNINGKTKVIGTRHGEKLFESLVSREEMSKAEDLENYYRIPADNRDLNYNNFFDVGDQDISSIEDYTSHNTHRLKVKEIEKLLKILDFVNGMLQK